MKGGIIQYCMEKVVFGADDKMQANVSDINYVK